MKKMYRSLIIGLAVLSLAGCAPSSQAPAEQNVEIEKGSQAGENLASGEVSAITLDTITDAQLAELTGFEVDFKAFMDNEPSRIVFLKDVDGTTEAVSNMLIYKGVGEDSTSLYIQEENGEVISAKLDEFNGSVNTEGQSCDFVFYSFANMLGKQPKEEALGYNAEKRDAFESDLIDNYKGQPLYTLHEKLGVYVPVYRYEMVDTELKLNTYTIVSEIGYTASTDVNVIYDAEGTIQGLYMDDSYGPGKLDPLKVLSAYK